MADADKVDLIFERGAHGLRRAGFGTCTAGAGDPVEDAEGATSGCGAGAAARDEGEKRHVRALRKLDVIEDVHERGEVATGDVSVGTGIGLGFDMEIGAT